MLYEEHADSTSALYLSMIFCQLEIFTFGREDFMVS